MPSELERELADPARRRVRRRVIAFQTCDTLTCPYCRVGPGHACVTFPRGRLARFPHAARVAARLREMP